MTNEHCVATSVLTISLTEMSKADTQVTVGVDYTREQKTLAVFVTTTSVLKY